MDAIFAGLFLAFITIFALANMFLTIYGLVTCFKKTWYFGLISLIIPAFAWVVGLSKFVFKTDILK